MWSDQSSISRFAAPAASRLAKGEANGLRVARDAPRISTGSTANGTLQVSLLFFREMAKRARRTAAEDSAEQHQLADARVDRQRRQRMPKRRQALRLLRGFNWLDQAEAAQDAQHVVNRVLAWRLRRLRERRPNRAQA